MATMDTSASNRHIQLETDENVSTPKLLSVICRVGLRQSLSQKFASLTVDEFSFVHNLLESGSDLNAYMNALQKSLCDEDVFFDPSRRQPKHWQEQHQGQQSNPNDVGGSARRKSQVEKRRSCSIHAELWKRASTAVVREPSSRDDLSTVRRTSQASMFSSVRETKEPQEWTLNALDEEIDDNNVVVDNSYEMRVRDVSISTLGQGNDAKLDKQPCISSPPPQPDRCLLTRMASQNLYNGEGFEVGSEELFDIYATPQYDPWDEETDRSGHAFDFKILGTSHYDQSTQPHVLSPPIMYALQSSLPLRHRGESFWLKYSMVRDGALATTFLQNVRASSCTLMAMETIDGEVFGAFTSSAWTIQPSFYGGGRESFLWRMKHSRAEPANSVLEQAKRETDLEIFHNNRQDPMVQLSRQDTIAVGGGTPLEPTMVSTGVILEPYQFGFGLAFVGDYLLEATSSPCLTFMSPSLSEIHSDGSKFELINLEVWALTPCITVEEARRMDYRRLFLNHHASY